MWRLCSTLLLIGVSAAVGANAAKAFFQDGSVLYQECISRSQADGALCLGFAIGLYDTMLLHESLAAGASLRHP